jgi:hypothetical protein
MTDEELEDAFAMALIRRGISDTASPVPDRHANAVLVARLVAIAQEHAAQPKEITR